MEIQNYIDVGDEEGSGFGFDEDAGDAEVKETFEAFDINKDGVVSDVELIEGLN